MNTGNVFIWNVRGLNSRARRSVVREFIAQERVSALCLVETKVGVLSASMLLDLMTTEFDYVCLPSVGASGGILVAWRRDVWHVSTHSCRLWSVTVNLVPAVSPDESWTLCTVYGPVRDEHKPAFLDELRAVRGQNVGPMLLCGDFNQIYRAADKSNDRLNLSAMRRFRRAIDDLQLQEIYLHGRLYTWSNQRRRPTLERIDRAFACVDWLEKFPSHHLRCLSSDCSDHSPLLLQLNSQPWAKPRFRFEAFWVKLDGFDEAVKRAWDTPLPGADACRLLDHKLRCTAKALQSWSMKNIGSVRSQLFITRELIAQFDRAQESRLLSEDEQALHKSLKLRSLGLASLSRTIARQRSRIRFLQEGDANTKYFHLQACHRNRKNVIPSVQSEGTWLSDEQAKADAFFEYYNAILGKPFTRVRSVLLDGLLPQLDLSGIDACFSEEEVWATIKEMPSDRAPGPNGFTGLFYKVSWAIIKTDVMNAVNALWSLDARSFNLLNDALLVLLRKNTTPSLLKDYRPIALMHSFSKLFAKCLARRLGPRLGDMVAPNQSAFIRGRSIHDNFRSIQLACKWLHSKKFPSLLLKIDIAKAFDSVGWPFLLEVLQHIGFPSRWREWISFLMSTASTRILLNGRPGRRIIHARGLRQGDPLSPMLFVIVMEVLNSLIAEADRGAALSSLPGQVLRHRASLYADDLVVLLAPVPADLVCLTDILRLFADASGLITNWEKCTATPIRCDMAAIQSLQQVFPFTISSFPSRYLGIPLSLRRLRHADEQPLIDAVAKRIPTWKAGLLTTAGRVALTKSTLSAIPVHTSIACCLSAWAVQQIDKRRRAFIWAGTETCDGGKCRLAWPAVCRPTDLGGLGVIDLRLFGYALRLRWEWLSRAEPDRCWTTLPSRPEHCVAAMLEASLSAQVGDGASVKLWTDNWATVGPLYRFAPAVFAATSRSGRKRTLRQALSNNRWARDITGELTLQVVREYLQVWDLLRDITLEPSRRDRFIWKWSPSGTFSVSSTYRAFFAGSTRLLGATELWRIKAPPKVKLFFWLALHRRLWTADRRKRHGLQDEDSCALCDQHQETVSHLFLGCVFARQVWAGVLLPLHLQDLVPPHEQEIAPWWISQRKRLDTASRPLFDSLLLLVTWCLWKERNARTFARPPSTPSQVVAAVLSEGADWATAGYAPLAALDLLWSLNGVTM